MDVSVSCTQCIIQLSAEASTTSLVDTVVSICPKCSVSKKGQPNCCARGGAWFGKCGREGDTNFDHTWDEGLRVCKHEILSGASEAKSKKFEELQAVGSYEQTVSRWTSTASPVFVIIAVLATLLLLVAVVGIMYFTMRRKKKSEHNNTITGDGNVYNMEPSAHSCIPVADESKEEFEKHVQVDSEDAAAASTNSKLM